MKQNLRIFLYISKIPCLILLGISCLFVSELAGGENSNTGGRLVFPYGSFDNPEDTAVPKGWKMWGDAKYKDSANYVIDTDNPHSGTGCFRIAQPKKTAGYINSDPFCSVRPKKGMMYEISFWARANVSGHSMLVIEGYVTADPLVGYNRVAWLRFPVGYEWQKVSLTLHEGWDFFVGKQNVLTTALFPYRGVADTDRTLWIDDFQIIEKPSDRQGRFINPTSIKTPPLQHRLRPGKTLKFTVDPQKTIRAMPEPISGVSMHRVAGWMGYPYNREGVYSLPRELEQAVRDMHLPMTRFYGLGDEKFSLEDAIDKAAAFCRKVRIPLETVVLEFETQYASSTLTPQQWARGVEHSVKKGYGFCHWEISNEPYSMHANAVFATRTAYLEHVIAVSKAIRKVQPKALIGMAVWGDDLFQRASGHYDFVVGHHYVFKPSSDKHPLEDIVLGANYSKLNEITHLNAYINACNPHRTVYQIDTEWGMHCDGARGATHNNRNANIYGTLHRAVRMIYYAREALVRGASSWEMFAPAPAEGYTFGFIPKNAPGQYYMFYWLYYFFNRYKGAIALETDGTAPWYRPEKNVFPEKDASGPLTPVLLSRDEAGDTISVIAVNGSWERSVPCEITILNFPAGQAKGIILSDDNPDASPLVRKKEDFVKPFPVTLKQNVLRFELPPHAAVFLRITKH